MKTHFATAVSTADKLVQALCARQEMSGAHRGVYRDPRNGLLEGAAWGAGMFCDHLISVYCAPRSRYYRSTALLERATLAMRHTLSCLREDGTMDQRASNYRDATATAFTVKVLFSAHQVLKGLGAGTPEEATLLTLMEGFFARAAEGMLHGGFHTPNHRWALCAAMAMCHKVAPDDRLPAMIACYLQEGIDQNEDGAYTEKSIGVYDGMVDLCFVQLAELLDRPELNGVVRHNLEMALYYLQPDGSLFTAHSSRQDKDTRVFPLRFYLPAVTLAQRENDPVFAAFAGQIFTRHLQDLTLEAEPPNVLGWYLLHPALQTYDPAELSPLPTRYERFFRASGLVRIRREDTVLSITQGQPNFLHLQVGGLGIRIRLFASFFARGQFTAQTITQDGDGYLATFHVRYGYIRPFANGSDTPAWREMDHGTWAHIERFNTPGLYPKWEEIDHGSRATCNEAILAFSLRLVPAKDGFRLRVASEGERGIPLKLEFELDAGGMLETPGMFLPGEAGTQVFPREGMCTYRLGNDSFSFGPAFAEHYAMRQRGAQGGGGAFTVCFNGETPVDVDCALRCQPLSSVDPEVLP